MRHEMITRLRKKIEPHPKEPVQLTEDLLYLVNKKLEQMDKEQRNKELEDLQRGKAQYKCFTEIKYRKLDVQLTETGQGVRKKTYRKLTETFSSYPKTANAVMHTTRFYSASIAITNLKSMQSFSSNLKRLRIADSDRRFDRQPSRYFSGFVQLPKEGDSENPGLSKLLYMIYT